MLKSFINAETGERVRLSKGDHNKAQLEKELKMEVKGSIPFADATDAKKRVGRPKKDLDTNENE